MRTKFLAVWLLLIVLAAGAGAAVVVEKRSREMPYVEVFECKGVHSFVFRGPKGTSRRPILVPPREYWTGQPAGIYSFVLRYNSGEVCSRLVTPEVFARYRVGDDFYAGQVSTESYQTEDSKAVQTVTQSRTETAQLRKKKRSSHRALAKHRRHHRSHRVAQR
ncbi:MAG TPA: hypothetical protein VM940_08695 [Chthoniobacterales bacterium]|jgi:hypothetical protein|nr:hypothetical protein [Chthoniobacterales bacterium]